MKLRTSLINPREAFAAMESPIAVIPSFFHSNHSFSTVCEIMKGLPIYADRQFALTNEISSLVKQPLMSKKDLRLNFPMGFIKPQDDFAELLASKKIEIVRTSGTSSDRLQVLWETGWWDKHERAALSQNTFIRPFINTNYREAVLTTPLCSDSVCKTGPLHLEERVVDDFLFLNTQEDPTRWTASHLQQMLDDTRNFKPVALEADPVYLAHLAHYLRASNQLPPDLKWIVLTYEFISGIHRTLVESIFNCPVFEFYGLTEAGVFFLECSQGRFHFCGQDSLIEIIRPSFPGTTQNNFPDSVGEVVVSTWGNKAEPLLRYRTNDLVEVDRGPCSCGLVSPAVKSFQGRIRDILTLDDGRTYTQRQIDSSLCGVKGLLQYICTQENPASIRISFVSDGSNDPREELHFRLSKLFSGINIRIEPHPFIAPEPSGKYRTVIPL